jgi:hypothetical protein
MKIDETDQVDSMMIGFDQTMIDSDQMNGVPRAPTPFRWETGETDVMTARAGIAIDPRTRIGTIGEATAIIRAGITTGVEALVRGRGHLGAVTESTGAVASGVHREMGIDTTMISGAGSILDESRMIIMIPLNA